jgi:hypothetical protein
MSWSDVAAAFRTARENVLRSVEMAVQWGLRHRSLAGIELLGIEEEWEASPLAGGRVSRGRGAASSHVLPAVVDGVPDFLTTCGGCRCIR